MISKFAKSIIVATSTVALIASMGTVAQAANETATTGAIRKIEASVNGQLNSAANGQVTGQAGKTGGGTGTGITYHGGPLMTSGITIYPIWYGTWTDANKALLNQFMSTIGGTKHFNINSTYKDKAGAAVKNVVTLGASTSDPAYSLGKTLSDAQIQTLVTTAIGTAKLPKDPNGFYLVLTSGDVTASSGFLTKYCGWHTYTTYATTAIKYSFVGDPSANLAACSGQTVSPNNNVAMDDMISVITHELEETATDPQLNGYYDGRGAENGDKCAWNFGTTTTLPSGAKYNMTFGGFNYYIQQNWINSGSGGCVLGL